MTEDEFQRIVRYPTYHRDHILLHLVAGDARGDLAEVMECLARFAGLHGWRLADLAEGGPAGDAESLRAAVDGLIGSLGRWRRERYPGEREQRAREFELARTAWRALMSVLASRGVDYHAQLAAVAKVVGKDVAPAPYHWSPPPRLPPHDDPPFTMQFGAHTLEMQDKTVTLASDSAIESVTFDGSDVAMLAFEVNALAFERAGLRGESSVPADVLGTLAPILELDDRSELQLVDNTVRVATIYDADSAGFYDGPIYEAERTPLTIGAFSAASSFPPGILGIHLLRRLFAHPAARECQIALILSYSIDTVLDWLAPRPEAARVTSLELLVLRHDQGELRIAPRPLGAQFPSVRTLVTGYRGWPRFSGATFPQLTNITLLDIHTDPPLGELAADLAAHVPKLHRLDIGRSTF